MTVDLSYVVPLVPLLFIIQSHTFSFSSVILMVRSILQVLRSYRKLHSTYKFHINTRLLISRLPALLLPERLASITSLKMSWRPLGAGEASVDPDKGCPIYNFKRQEVIYTFVHKPERQFLLRISILKSL